MDGNDRFLPDQRRQCVLCGHKTAAIVIKRADGTERRLVIDTGTAEVVTYRGGVPEMVEIYQPHYQTCSERLGTENVRAVTA